jgi:hypothetical protein
MPAWQSRSGQPQATNNVDITETRIIIFIFLSLSALTSNRNPVPETI